MEDKQVYAALEEIFANVFHRNDIQLRPELTAKDVEGWDSFKQVELILSVEDTFGIKVHSREFDNLENLNDLVKIVVAKTISA